MLERCKVYDMIAKYIKHRVYPQCIVLCSFLLYIILETTQALSP